MGLADSLKYSIGGSQGSTNMTNIPVEYAKTISTKHSEPYYLRTNLSHEATIRNLSIHMGTYRRYTKLWPKPGC